MAVVQNRIRLAELRLFLFQVFLLARFQGQTIQFFHLIPQKLEFGLCFIGILLAFGQPLADLVPGFPGFPCFSGQGLNAGELVHQLAVGFLAQKRLVLMLAVNIH